MKSTALALAVVLAIAGFSVANPVTESTSPSACTYILGKKYCW